MVNTRKRIVLATISSLGDLHPMIALALELRRRGYDATSERRKSRGKCKRKTACVSRATPSSSTLRTKHSKCFKN